MKKRIARRLRAVAQRLDPAPPPSAFIFGNTYTTSATPITIAYPPR